MDAWQSTARNEIGRLSKVDILKTVEVTTRLLLCARAQQNRHQHQFVCFPSNGENKVGKIREKQKER